MQAALIFPGVCFFLLTDRPHWAGLLLLAAAVGIAADGLTLLSMRLPGGYGLGVGLILRWSLLLAALAFAASRLPLWPEMLMFAVCLAALRPLAMALQTALQPATAKEG